MKFEILNIIFQRNRIPKEILLKAFYEYIGSKNGLRTVAYFNGITHQALWYWVKKVERFREELHKMVIAKGGVPDVIIVDETELNTTQGKFLLCMVRS